MKTQFFAVFMAPNSLLYLIGTFSDTILLDLLVQICFNGDCLERSSALTVEIFMGRLKEGSVIRLKQVAGDLMLRRRYYIKHLVEQVW